VEYLSKTLAGVEDLTPAERDYYGILNTYLLSAWQGRVADDESTEAPVGKTAASKRAGKESKRQQLDAIFE
jgi:hypothetical protein